MPISTIMLVTVLSAWTRCESGASSADGRGHAGAGEQHRDAGGDQGAEGQQHQDQGDREAQRLGRAEVLGDPVVDRGVEADVAGLADVELREVGLHGARSTSCRGATSSWSRASWIETR